MKLIDRKRIIASSGSSSGSKPLLSTEQWEDFLFYMMVGIIAGGRLGYVLFYNFSYFVSNPLEIFFIWQGGMAFHGGLLGVIVAMLIFCRDNDVRFLHIADLIAPAVPIGLFFGRVANFINGELYGRAAEPGTEWAMIFPSDPLALPRHPSQLYEAFFEGLVLFVLLSALVWLTNLRRQMPGVIAALFMIGYGMARFFIEYYREPDEHLGLVWLELSQGQLLSLPMIIVGFGLLIVSVLKIKIVRAKS